VFLGVGTGEAMNETPVTGGAFPGRKLLTTTGRRSGQPRTAPLIYGRRGDDYLIVAQARTRAECGRAGASVLATVSDRVSDVATAECIRQPTPPLAKERAPVPPCRRARS